MSKAFLSHSSQNKNLVEKIGLQLGRNNVHLDSLTFEAGEKTIEEIFKGLDETDIFVLFISEPALQSRWVQDEISYAKVLLDKKIIERIFPLIIDKTITYNDPRIPDWIKKPYNIKLFDNEVLIYQKIKQLLRESNFKKFSHLKEIHELFIGRHDLFQEFDRRIFNIDNIVPSCLIAHNFFEGMGRRSFLKNALVRNSMIDKWYEPVYIPFNSKQSIEDFIHKLNFIERTKEIFDYDLTKENLDSKIVIARELVKKFVKNNELIFVIDDGGIVLPNTLIVPWFLQMLDGELGNEISVCIVSKFKPKPIVVRKHKSLASFQVDELSPPDVQALFVRYLSYLGINIMPDDARFFLEHFHGIPGQVIYAANLIANSGVQEAKRYVSDIDEFDELSVLTVLDFLKDDNLCRQMLIALSRFEIISYDIIHKIFGENEDVYKSLQRLYDLGLFYHVSSTHQYLKLNNSIADYINRSRLDLDNEYNKNLRELIKDSISKPLDIDENSDYSEFLISIADLIRSGKSIPAKYSIPSFILKSIVQEYYSRNYDVVVSLATKIIDAGNNFDPQIIRETRYWLCLAYCRIQNDKFFDEVRFFKDGTDLFNLKDYYFLLGFYYRLADDMDRAEENFKNVLSIDKGHSKTNREMVNVYLRKRDYASALELAAINYSNHKSNIHHINAYFTCLIKMHNLNDSDIDTLVVLLEKTKKSLDKRADEFYNTMKAEYEYYVERHSKKAIDDLKEFLRLNKHNYHAFKALSEIFRIEGLSIELEKLRKTYPNLNKQDD